MFYNWSVSLGTDPLTRGLNSFGVNLLQLHNSNLLFIVAARNSR